MRQKTAFTLIELLIVILIVAILASVAVPIMQGAKKKAIVTEAITGLSFIRNAERLYYVEYGSYIDTFSNLAMPPGIPGIERSDLKGLYFRASCYETSEHGGRHGGRLWAAFCDISISSVPEVESWKRVPGDDWGWCYIAMTLDDGAIYSNVDGLGFELIPEGQN